MNEAANTQTTTAHSTPPDLFTPTAKILATGRWTEKAASPADRFPVMLKEVPAAVRLYLTGKIDSWYVKPDLSGVVFMMNVATAEEAQQLLEILPLGQAGMMVFDLTPLGSLSPLRFLLND